MVDKIRYTNKVDAMAAVSQYGYYLAYASAELRADRDIVMAAVENNGWALQYASDALKADREVVMAVVTQDGIPLQFASDVLKTDLSRSCDGSSKRKWLCITICKR